jgi:hypothetical protein
MIPEKQTDFGPDDSRVGDRLFSQLPLQERWRLIKEALDETRLYEGDEHSDHHLKAKLGTLGFVLGASIAFTIVPATFPAKYSFASFGFGLWIWLYFHFFLVVALLAAAQVFERRERRFPMLINRALSEIEQMTLAQKEE